MKTTVANYLLSLEINEVIEIIASSLEERGFSIITPISVQDLEKMLVSKVLQIEAKKNDASFEGKTIVFSLEEEEIVLSLEEKEINFSDTFLRRAGTGRVGLQMFIHNVSKKQISYFANKAFNEISVDDQKLLSFVFSLSGKKFESEKIKSAAEIKEKIGPAEYFPGLALKTMHNFAEIMYTMLVGALNDEELTLKFAMEKSQLLERNIGSVGFSNQTQNCFYANDYKTISDLVEFGEQKFKAMRSFGQRSLKEVTYFKKLYKL